MRGRREHPETESGGGANGEGVRMRKKGKDGRSRFPRGGRARAVRLAACVRARGKIDVSHKARRVRASMAHVFSIRAANASPSRDGSRVSTPSPASAPQDGDLDDAEQELREASAPPVPRLASAPSGEKEEEEQDRVNSDRRSATIASPQAQVAGVARRGGGAGRAPARARRVSSFFRAERANADDTLAKIQESSRAQRNQFLDATLEQRERTVVANLQASLAAGGAVAPLLLINVPYQTADSLLLFHASQLMLLLLSDAIPLGAPEQGALLSLFEAVGVDRHLLHDVGARAIGFSLTTGEFLLRTFEYEEWLKHGRPLQQPEPLNSCFKHLVLARTDLGSCTGALVDLSAAVADGDLTSSGAALVYRCVALVSALSVRYAMEPLSLGDILPGLKHILSLGSSALKRSKAALTSALRAADQRAASPNLSPAWMETLGRLPRARHKNVAAFLDLDAAMEAALTRRPKFVRVARAELALRMYAMCAVQLTLVGAVPGFLSALGTSVGAICIVCHPAFPERHELDVAASLLLLLHEAGLDARAVQLLASSADVYAFSNTSAFARRRLATAERLEASISTANTHTLVADFAGRTKVNELRNKVRLLFQSLPAHSRAPIPVPPLSAESPADLHSLLGAQEEGHEMRAIAVLEALEGAASAGAAARDHSAARALSSARSQTRSYAARPASGSRRGSGTRHPVQRAPSGSAKKEPSGAQGVREASHAEGGGRSATVTGVGGGSSLRPDSARAPSPASRSASNRRRSGTRAASAREHELAAPRAGTEREQTPVAASDEEHVAPHAAPDARAPGTRAATERSEASRSASSGRRASPTAGRSRGSLRRGSSSSASAGRPEASASSSS